MSDADLRSSARKLLNALAHPLRVQDKNRDLLLTRIGTQGGTGKFESITHDGELQPTGTKLVFGIEYQQRGHVYEGSYFIKVEIAAGPKYGERVGTYGSLNPTAFSVDESASVAAYDALGISIAQRMSAYRVSSPHSGVRFEIECE